MKIYLQQLPSLQSAMTILEPPGLGHMKAWNSQEGFGVISWELSGRESLEDFITFKSENLKNGRTIFDFFISEDKLTMVSGEIANFSDLDSYITVKTGWYKLRKYDLDLGNVDKFGKFLCYRFENS
jgi:hypothetical protein